MLYAILILLLVTLILVVVFYLLLDRSILANARKDRELARAREDRLNVTVNFLKEAVLKMIASEQEVMKQQTALEENLATLSTIVDDHNSYLTLQQGQFKEFAKSDMLAARRDELIRLKELKIALERIMSMTTSSRQTPATIDLFALESVKNRIEELETILLDNGKEGD